MFKVCHQLCYGFENLMSSWRVWISFSKLLWGNVFLKNHAKSKVFQINRRPQAFFVKILCQVGDSIFIAAEVSTKPVHSPSGVQRNLRTRRGAPSLMGWLGRVGRVRRSSKVSFKFLQTLWVFRTCLYILAYEIKIVTNILMGFKMWCQVWGLGQNFQIYSR